MNARQEKERVASDIMRSHRNGMSIDCSDKQEATVYFIDYLAYSVFVDSVIRLEERRKMLGEEIKTLQAAKAILQKGF